MTSLGLGMSDLNFAIDALYAAGWWPGDGDRCAKGPGGRWFPEQDEVMRRFADAGIRPSLRQYGPGQVFELKWDSPRTGRHRVLANSPEEAAVHGFACLCRHISLVSQSPPARHFSRETALPARCTT